jgi:hypothetical protein
VAKKKSGQKTRKGPAPKKGKASNRTWIIAAVVVAAIVGLVILSGTGAQDGSGPTVTTEEQSYIGRLLPTGYEPPQIGGVSLYTQTHAMSDATATQADGTVSIPTDSVRQDKIVRFAYTRADGASLPMLAYLKPSGELFVGVNYCPPCEGEGQRIEADGTLTCESCGTKRDLETNSGISGACRLYPLDEVPATIDGDSIRVDGAVLDAWMPQPLDRPVG